MAEEGTSRTVLIHIYRVDSHREHHTLTAYEVNDKDDDTPSNTGTLYKEAMAGVLYVSHQHHLVHSER